MRFLSTYFATVCKLTVGAAGCTTGTGLDALEEWDRGLDDTILELDASCWWEEWCECELLDSFTTATGGCWVNTTGEPGELCTCNLSSFLCIATETGETASCGRGAAGVTVEAAVFQGEKT